MIKELNLLRTIACLSIVFLHSTTLMGRVVGHPQIELYHFSRIALCFATPTFVVLSIIILANRYRDNLPENFWASRFKFIYLPYVSFAVIDAFVVKYFEPHVLLDQRILENLLTGKFVGWFILVIFQLYFLYYFVVKYKLSMKWLFPISLLISTVYLTRIYGDINIPFLKNFEYTLKLPFLAWFGYFTIAVIIGKHYKLISEKLLKYRWLTFLWFFISLSILYISYRSGITGIHSRRLDLYPLVLSITAVILAWGQLIPKSKLINTISNYSFGIYLLHWEIQRFIAPYVGQYFIHRSTKIIVLFITSLFLSMVIIKIISHLPLGSYVIGTVKRQKPGIINKKSITNAV